MGIDKDRILSLIGEIEKSLTILNEYSSIQKKNSLQI